MNTGIRIALVACGIGALATVSAFLSEGGSLTPPLSGVSFPMLEKEELPTGDFLEVMEGCDSAYAGDCVTAHTGPGEAYPIALQMRIGMVLKVATSSVMDELGNPWRKVLFDEWIRYPGRMGKELYVMESSVRIHTEPIHTELPDDVEPVLTTKRIVVDRSDQMLYAYDGDTLEFSYPVSTGLSSTPTPRGEFRVYKKMPTRYMQGPLPGISSQYYDLPGVPWDLYFTKEGGTIHGAYWHDSFGKVWSHGCVNLSPAASKVIYDWTPVGTPVLVRD